VQPAESVSVSAATRQCGAQFIHSSHLRSSQKWSYGPWSLRVVGGRLIRVNTLETPRPIARDGKFRPRAGGRDESQSRHAGRETVAVQCMAGALVPSGTPREGKVPRDRCEIDARSVRQADRGPAVTASAAAGVAACTAQARCGPWLQRRDSRARGGSAREAREARRGEGLPCGGLGGLHIMRSHSAYRPST
jgi:hypothetical protein